MMNLEIFFAAFGMSLLELSKAFGVVIIFSGIYRSINPYFYAVLGVLIVLVPDFTLGKYISFLPINYVLVAASIVLFYLGYKLLRSARRSFKGIRKNTQEEENIKDIPKNRNDDASKNISRLNNSLSRSCLSAKSPIKGDSNPESRV